MEYFKKELEVLINRHSIENKADVPDFILAEMVCVFIRSIGPQIKRTLDWHGCDSVCHPARPLVEIENKYTIGEQYLRECMARAYCHKENEKKDLDATLIEAMIREIKDACCDGG